MEKIGQAFTCPLFLPSFRKEYDFKTNLKKGLTHSFVGDMVSYTSNEPNNKKRRRIELQEYFSEEKSIYLQISEMIETDILRGVLMEEERVPSTNELAKLYLINPATAAKGINILVDNGILYKKRGIGMFVSTGAKEKILESRRNSFFDNYIKTLIEEASKLGITKEELMEMIRRG